MPAFSWWAHNRDLRAWAASAWQARQTPAPGRALLAHLLVGLSLLVGLLALPFVRAWQAGSQPTVQVQAVVVAVVVVHAFCVWGVWRVARWRGQLREHRLRILQACTVPGDARALVDTAMQLSGRGIPHDREAFVLLRNEVTALSGVDPFTAAVLVWEVTIGPAPPAHAYEWLGGLTGGYPPRC